MSLTFFLINPIQLNPAAQLNEANRVFSQCQVQFHLQTTYNLDPQISPFVIGRDLTVEWDHDERSEATVISRMFANAPGRIKVFFLRDTGIPAAFSIGRTFDRLHGHSLGERIFISDDSRPDTLAHELGHVLLDDSDSFSHSPDPANLMAEGNTRTGQSLTAQQCSRIRASAQSTFSSP